MPRILWFACVAALSGCGDVSSMVDALVGDAPAIDAAVPDTMIDAPDAATAPPRRNTIASTSGGGRIASSAHRMRVRIGAPQPSGTTQSATHRVVTGPGAMP